MNIDITLSLQNIGDTRASTLRLDNVRSILISQEEITFETIGNGRTVIQLQGRVVLFTQASENK